jgi:hypothetical protein
MRRNDVRASFSSNGPTRGDYLAKPDLLAPGYGILLARGSAAARSLTRISSSWYWLAEDGVCAVSEP